MNKKQNAQVNKDLQFPSVKIPPHSLEAEQSTIGGLMLDQYAWDKIEGVLHESDFYSRSHALIFNAIKNLALVNSNIDLVTVSEYLETNGKLEEANGFNYLAEITKNTPSAANIASYAAIIKERSIIRKLIGTANEIADAGFKPQGRDANALLDFAENRIFEIGENRDTIGPVDIKDVLRSTIDKIELLATLDSDLTGLSSGFADLDKKTTGFQNGDLIIIAARPSMGKTTFAMNICEHAALNAEKPVLIFSLEMPAEQLMMRMLASLSRVDQTRIRTGKLLDDDWSRLGANTAILKENANMFIDDSAGLTPGELRARARRVFKDHNGLSMIMVDYLQLMRSNDDRVKNRTEEISEISRSLKALAKELKIPVIALSQLNRSLEQRADKRPINSDLRESGAIEQDADIIMFIYRDEVYNEESKRKGEAEIIIGKQRNGPIGKIHLAFNGQFSRFDNLAVYRDEDDY